jgi:hypothetical protein
MNFLEKNTRNHINNEASRWCVYILKFEKKTYFKLELQCFSFKYTYVNEIYTL